MIEMWLGGGRGRAELLWDAFRPRNRRWSIRPRMCSTDPPCSRRPVVGKEFLETLDSSRREENIDFYHIAAAYDVIDEWFNDPRHGTPLQSAIDLHTALTKWVCDLVRGARGGESE